MEKLNRTSEREDWKMREKINEIVDWINKHEENPPYVKPPVIG